MFFNSLINLFNIAFVFLSIIMIIWFFSTSETQKIIEKIEKMFKITQPTNYSNYEAESSILLNAFSKATVIILYSEMICCLFLNSFTIVNLFFNPTVRGSKHILINLAISDMLYSSCIPFYSSQFINDRIDRSFLSCASSFVLDVSSTIVSNDHFMTFYFGYFWSKIKIFPLKFI